jgi:crotonobetainyl-CoA:carnitine CoA-transferase CaiB-like acyl-CoA transferase
MSDGGPLAGLTVAELGSTTAVRFCGRILADLGAEVLALAPSVGPGDGGFLGRGKGTVDLDVAGLEDLSAINELAGRSDVILDRPRTRPDGIGWLPALEKHPHLRVVSLSNFGLSGPIADLDGSEILAWARSGYMALTGDRDGAPLLVPGQGAVQAAVNGAIGVLASLVADDATADERWIDVSIQESLAFHIAGAAADAELAGRIFSRVGNAVAVAAGGGHNYTAIHPCRDGFVLCGVTFGEPVRRLLTMMGLPLGPDTAELEERPGDHPAKLDDLCTRWVGRRTVAEAVSESTAAGLHWAAVESPQAVLASPHLAHRDYFASDGTSVWPRHPFRLELAEGSASRDVGSGSSGPLPLSGVNVVEVGTMVAAPYAGALLADLGAYVVKIEPPGGDILRRSTDFTHRRPWFHEVNRQKASACLDLGQQADLSEFGRLIEAADIVLHNLRPGVAERLGFDHATVHEIKPDAVVVQVSAFGSHGPDGSRKGTNATVDAASGLAAVTGYRGGLPLRPGNIYCDMTAALYATVAALAGLYVRRTTGRGSSVDVAMLEVASYGLGDVLRTASERGVDPLRAGNQSPVHAPHGCYPTADGGWVAISVENDRHWERFSALVAQPFPTGWDDLAVRRQEVMALDEAVARWSVGWKREELVAMLNDAGVLAAPVVGPEELLDDPQLIHRRFFGWVDAGDDGRIPLPQLAMLRSPDRVPLPRARAPQLDEGLSPRVSVGSSG